MSGRLVSMAQTISELLIVPIAVIFAIIFGLPSADFLRLAGVARLHGFDGRLQCGQVAIRSLSDQN